jgi:hypothetical protein
MYKKESHWPFKPIEKVPIRAFYTRSQFVEESPQNSYPVDKFTLHLSQMHRCVEGSLSRSYDTSKSAHPLVLHLTARQKTRT